MPERVSSVLLAVQKQFKFTHILASASTFSRGVIPRTAAFLDVSPISEITAVHGEDTFSRPTYAGNAIAKVIDHFLKLAFIIKGEKQCDNKNDHNSSNSIRSIPRRWRLSDRRERFINFDTNSIYLFNQFFHIAPDAEINTEASEFLGQELSKLVLQNIFMLFILK